MGVANGNEYHLLSTFYVSSTTLVFYLIKDANKKANFVIYISAYASSHQTQLILKV